MNPVQFESLYPATAWSMQIEQLVRLVKEGKSSQLIAAPGVGRSVVLGLLTYNTAVREKHFGKEQSSYHFVHVDFSEIRHRPLSDVMKMLFLALADSLRDRKMQESYELVNELLRGALRMQDELVMTEELKHAIEILVYEKKMHVVFLFDRFEEYVPMVTSGLFANLRLFRNRAKYHFSVIFSSNKPLEDLVEPVTLSDFADMLAGNAIYLPLFDSVSVDFRLEHVEKLTGKKLPKKLYDAILVLTAGHGKLTRAAVEALFIKEKEEENLPVFLLSQQTVRGALKDIWLSLSPVEQEYMRSVLQEKNVEDSAPQSFLQKIGLISEGKITIPLLQSYVEDVSVAQSAEDQKIVYEENSNKINKGSLTLSDDLTSSEFLLFRYLVLHPEEIITRDQLIAIVWGDNRSTAGVTDQAFDQLLFRLRKKIEENPNSPTHLQTIKGRGVKFTA